MAPITTGSCRLAAKGESGGDDVGDGDCGSDDVVDGGGGNSKLFVHLYSSLLLMSSNKISLSAD